VHFWLTVCVVEPALFATIDHLTWFYERQGEHMRCEIRQLLEGDRFSLVVTSSASNRRSIELEKTLVQKGWNGPFARGI